jgi:hypothetical protein
MHITLVDDSIAFDGYSAASRPLGGAEKAFASLPGALARRGHTVVVFNRCRWGMHVEGVQWEPIEEGRKPPRTDLLIAYRKPSLLEFVRLSGRRALWFTGPGRLLGRPATRQALAALNPLVLLIAEAQAREFEPRGLATALLPPAVRADFLTGTPEPAAVPRAVVTTHPAHGLDWLLDLWIDRIRPAVPGAELHLLSMTLARAAEGGEVEDSLRPLAAKALAARADHGVVIARPEGDFSMAATWRAASVHLFPGHADDMGCHTLMESQASGCPAVLRPLGAAPERVADGVSAYVAPDDDAFANLAALLLAESGLRASMGAEARARMAGRDWAAAAAALEGWVS